MLCSDSNQRLITINIVWSERNWEMCVNGPTCRYSSVCWWIRSIYECHMRLKWCNVSTIGLNRYFAEFNGFFTPFFGITAENYSMRHKMQTKFHQESTHTRLSSVFNWWQLPTSALYGEEKKTLIRSLRDKKNNNVTTGRNHTQTIFVLGHLVDLWPDSVQVRFRYSFSFSLK